MNVLHFTGCLCYYLLLVVAWMLSDNTQFGVHVTIGLIACASIPFAISGFQETPRWLVINGRKEEAELLLLVMTILSLTLLKPMV